MASTAYISASGNRFSHCADVSSESLVAFGSSRLIGLWSLDNKFDYGVFATLPGHEGLVTCVRFVQNDLFVSGDDKGLVLLWKRIGTEWKSTFKLQAHSKPVSALAVQGDSVVTGASDSLLKVWKVVDRENDSILEEKQSLSLQNRYPLALALASLPHSSVDILAVGGTDKSVQLWLRSEDTFLHSATLAGHEDWIRCLSFQQGSKNHPLVLASGSQDGNIRLWNIEPLERTSSRPITDIQSTELSDDLLDAFEASLGDVAEGEEGGKQISLKRHILTAKTTNSGTQQFSVTFDALLVGHESGLTSLHWRPKANEGSPPILLSTSTDSSLILWTQSSAFTSIQGGPSIWINYQRFGDVGGQRLGGFIGGSWANSGKDALAWGWSGGWRRFKCLNGEKGPTSEVWNEVGAITGHSGSVRGIDWSPNGDYLISTGLDQTTRIHGGIPVSEPSAISSWHELGRPQIHGYDLLNAVFINDLKFASIADEKVVRVFEAPRSFVDALEILKVSQFSEDEAHSCPAGASVPPLGLSNKAVGEGSSQALAINELDISRRPFEGELATSTLWPEIEKVFGHGYESVSLAVSNSHRFIATACKATSAEHAVIRVYDSQSFQPFGQPLAGHALTVTRIAFRPDDKYILTVSRDRSWRLFELIDNAGFVPVATDKSHGRIIWDCSWAHEGDIFATASRDKTVRIWGQSAEGSKKWSAIETIKTSDPATAVAFAAADGHPRRRLAIGLETGTILIYSSAMTTPTQWRLDLTIDSRTAHVDHINRLAWRSMDGGSTQLASCSEDGTLKIFIVQFNTD